LHAKPKSRDYVFMGNPRGQCRLSNQITSVNPKVWSLSHVKRQKRAEAHQATTLKKVKMPVGARRTQSMPSKYMIPSSNIGEYEAGRRKSAPAKPPHLFPLDEEGTYGMPPKGPAPAPKPFSRERKTKIYSSYSVDKSCNVHAKQLAKVEEQRNREMEEQRAQRRRKSFNTSRRPSASPSRASSEARSSKSPEPRQYQNGVIPSSNMGEYEGGRRKSAPKKSSGSDHGRKMTPTTGSG
jgi:hypothetical protein